jgi:hypothetical protein
LTSVAGHSVLMVSERPSKEERQLQAAKKAEAAKQAAAAAGVTYEPHVGEEEDAEGEEE